MTFSTRRFAAVALAAAAPLAAVSIATAAPSYAECTSDQSQFNGNCVDSNCKKNEVRNSHSGQCQDVLSAALSKAQAPAVTRLTPDQATSAARIAQAAGILPGGGGGGGGSFGVGSILSIVNTAVDIPTRVASAASDTADTLSFLYNVGGGSASTGVASAASSSVKSALSVAKSLPSPKVGLPKVGAPKIGLPKVGLPKPHLLGLCGPRLLFFKPCI